VYNLSSVEALDPAVSSPLKARQAFVEEAVGHINPIPEAK
jgi:hypothetical protein